MDKYKISTYENSAGLWEARYVKPATSGSGNLVLSGEEVKLGKFFKTEIEANNFTEEHLLKNGIPKDLIIVRMDLD